MWKTTGYLISLDKLQEDKKQKASSRGTVVINKKITAKKFKEIKKILKLED